MSGGRGRAAPIPRVRLRATPLLIRLVVLLSGLSLCWAAPHPHAATVVITAAGAVIAATVPAYLGPAVVTVGFVLAWLVTSGAHDLPSILRTVLAAAALYVVHESTALAAFVPLDAEVDREVVRRWLGRCVVPVLAAAAVIAVDEVLPRRSGPALIELAGIVGVLVAVGVVSRVLWPSSRAPAPRG